MGDGVLQTSKLLEAPAGSAVQPQTAVQNPTPILRETVLSAREVHLASAAPLTGIDNFEILNAVDQARALRVLDAVHSYSPKEATELVEWLLTQSGPKGGLVMSQTHGGKTVLEILDRPATAAGLDRRLADLEVTPGQLITEALRAMRDASLACQDSTKATCPAAGLEYPALRSGAIENSFARYAACVSALGLDGRFVTRGGVIELPAELPADKRTAISSLFQSGFMNFMSDFGYDARRDKMHSEQGIHTGSYCSDVERAFEAYFEQGFTRFNREAAGFQAALDASIANGTINGGTIKGLSKSDMHALHFVNFVNPADYESLAGRFTADGPNYFFRNPWGNLDLRDGQGGAVLVDAKEGIYMLPKDEALKRMTYVLVQGGAMGVTPGATDEETLPVFVVLPAAPRREDAQPKEKRSSTADPQAVSMERDAPAEFVPSVDSAVAPAQPQLEGEYYRRTAEESAGRKSRKNGKDDFAISS